MLVGQDRASWAALMCTDREPRGVACLQGELTAAAPRSGSDNGSVGSIWWKPCTIRDGLLNASAAPRDRSHRAAGAIGSLYRSWTI